MTISRWFFVRLRPFNSRMEANRRRNRFLSDAERCRVVSMLLGMCIDGVLPHGKLEVVARHFNVSRPTISRLGARALVSRVTGVPNTPELISRKNGVQNALKYSKSPIGCNSHLLLQNSDFCFGWSNPTLSQTAFLSQLHRNQVGLWFRMAVLHGAPSIRCWIVISAAFLCQVWIQR